MRILLIAIAWVLILTGYIVAADLEENFSLPDDLELDLSEGSEIGLISEQNFQEILSSESQEKISTGNNLLSNDNKTSNYDNLSSSKSLLFGINQRVTTNKEQSSYFYGLNFSSSLNSIEFGFLDFDGTIIKSSSDTEPKFTVNLLKLQNSSGDFGWSIGKYRLTWGQVEGTGVLDVINPAGANLLEGVDSDIPEGRWLFNGSLFLDPVRITTFGSIKLNNKNEYGAGLDINLDPYKLSFYTASLFPRNSFDLLTGSQVLNERYNLLGFSAYKVQNAFLLKLDLSAKINMARVGTIPIVQDRFDLALGLEYFASNSRKYAVHLSCFSWVQNSTPTHTDNNLVNQLEPISGSNYQVSVQEQFFNNNLSINLGMSGKTNDQNILLGVNGNYQISDDIKLLGSIASFKTISESMRLDFQPLTIVNVTLRKYF